MLCLGGVYVPERPRVRDPRQVGGHTVLSALRRPDASQGAFNASTGRLLPFWNGPSFTGGTKLPATAYAD